MANENKFSKTALVTSKGFKPIERDMLSIRLDPEKLYTKAEAEQIIKEFKGGIR
ncbi:hypothetical protein [Secundilactobacillus muriivasis]